MSRQLSARSSPRTDCLQRLSIHDQLHYTRFMINCTTMVGRRVALKTFGGYMAQVKITVRNNGPFRVEAPEGSVELVDADGKPYDLTGKPAFSLCRCGGSTNKPFCDGTHSRIGFEAAERAVAAVVKLETPGQEPPK